MNNEYALTKKHYNTLDYYLKTKYGKKVFKVSLNANFTCPNRDGTKGVGGCAFCSSHGSGDFAGNPRDSLITQFESVKDTISKKWNDAYYIAYFQAYSNTYGSIDKLKATFETFIDYPNVIGLSIATRVDCINEEIVTYLSSLKKHFKEFWVELGVQTSNRKTAKMMNLCYTFNDVKRAVKLLHKANIDVICHIIDGLPLEKETDMINTINDINRLNVEGIKIHLLNVIRGTKIATMYQNREFEIEGEEFFIKVIAKQIATLNEDTIIHRIGADVNADDLIAPTWILKKFTFIDKIDKYLEENDIFQGDLKGE